MRPEDVRKYFELPKVVEEYMLAAVRVGLWESEKIVVKKFVPNLGSKILELGCGAGRIAHGLSKLGYSDVLATDFSPEMVRASKLVGEQLGSSAESECLDALKADERFCENSFDAVIFGFNGLMQIPKRENRRKVLSGIFKILKAGGVFIFTTHDRAVKRNAPYWERERKLWSRNEQASELDEFGDICYEASGGKLFIHSPLSEEVEEDLNKAGFKLVFSSRRSDMAIEPPRVLDFSDDCVFRVVSK